MLRENIAYIFKVCELNRCFSSVFLKLNSPIHNIDINNSPIHNIDIKNSTVHNMQNYTLYTIKCLAIPRKRLNTKQSGT